MVAQVHSSLPVIALIHLHSYKAPQTIRGSEPTLAPFFPEAWRGPGLGLQPLIPGSPGGSPSFQGALSFRTSQGIREESDLEADKDLKRDPNAVCAVGS